MSSNITRINEDFLILRSQFFLLLGSVQLLGGVKRNAADSVSTWIAEWRWRAAQLRVVVSCQMSSPSPSFFATRKATAPLASWTLSRSPLLCRTSTFNNSSPPIATPFLQSITAISKSLKRASTMSQNRKNPFGISSSSNQSLNLVALNAVNKFILKNPMQFHQYLLNNCRP